MGKLATNKLPTTKLTKPQLQQLSTFTDPGTILDTLNEEGWNIQKAIRYLVNIVEGTDKDSTRLNALKYLNQLIIDCMERSGMMVLATKKTYGEAGEEVTFTGHVVQSILKDTSHHTTMEDLKGDNNDKEETGTSGDSRDGGDSEGPGRGTERDGSPDSGGSSEREHGTVNEGEPPRNPGATETGLSNDLHTSKPPEAYLEAFKGIPVANIADAMGKPSHFTIDPSIRLAFNGTSLLGSALTVKDKPGCNLMTHAAIDLAEEGDVLVIDAESHLNVATGGFMMGRKMIHKGIRGVVIDGAWRDKSEVIKARFPVYCRGWQPTGPNKELAGSVNVPITCGGIVVNPGDIVVGDDDGVIIIPQGIADDIANEAKKIMEIEVKRTEETRTEIITAPSPYASSKRLKELGVEIQ